MRTGGGGGAQGEKERNENLRWEIHSLVGEGERLRERKGKGSECSYSVQDSKGANLVRQLFVKKG